MSDRLKTLEAALLFAGECPSIDAAALLVALNEKATDIGLTFHDDTTWDSDGDELAFSNPEAHVLIARSTVPLAADLFAPALAAPVVGAQNLDYAQQVATHASAIRVTISEGPAYASMGHVSYADSAEAAQSADRAGLLTKIQVLQGALGALMGHAMPTLVWWQQSDMLFPAQIAAMACQLPFPSPLVINPEFTYGGDAPDGTRSVGFRAHGSELFCGRRIDIAPAPVAFPELNALVDYLLLSHIQGAEALGDGDVIRFSQDHQVRVDHAPGDAACPTGRILLTLEETKPIAPTVAPTVATAAPRASDPAMADAPPAGDTAPAPGSATTDATKDVANPSATGATLNVTLFLERDPRQGDGRGLPDPDYLLAVLNEATAPRDLRFALLADAPGDQGDPDRLFACESANGQERITLTRTPGPVDTNAYPLGLPLAPETTDRDTLVARIAGAAAALTLQLRGPEIQDALAFETRAFLARALTQTLLQNLPVAALHWGGSNRIAAPREAATACAHPLPLYLYTSPDPLEGSRARLSGAEPFLGHPLVLDGIDTVPPQGVATGFVAHCHRHDTIPKPGTIFTFNRHTHYQVASPTDQDWLPAGTIVLREVETGPADLVLDGTPAPRAPFPATLNEARAFAAPLPQPIPREALRAPASRPTPRPARRAGGTPLSGAPAGGRLLQALRANPKPRYGIAALVVTLALFSAVRVFNGTDAIRGEPVATPAITLSAPGDSNGQGATPPVTRE